MGKGGVEKAGGRGGMDSGWVINGGGESEVN